MSKVVCGLFGHLQLAITQVENSFKTSLGKIAFEQFSGTFQKQSCQRTPLESVLPKKKKTGELLPPVLYFYKS